MEMKTINIDDAIVLDNRKILYFLIIINRKFKHNNDHIVMKIRKNATFINVHQ